MNLTNESYTILLHGRSWTERYYRDKTGWIKESARGREFRATAEQVLNHLLPALAGIKRRVTVAVEHHEPSRDQRQGRVQRQAGPTPQLSNAPRPSRVRPPRTRSD